MNPLNPLNPMNPRAKGASLNPHAAGVSKKRVPKKTVLPEKREHCFFYQRL